MRSRRPVLSLVALLSLGGLARGEEPPDFVIKGATLELREPGATIQAPSVYWKWARLEEQKDSAFQTYRCSNLINERDIFLLLVSREPVPPLEAARMDDVVSDIRRGGLPENFVIAAPRHEPSDLPWPGSYRLQYELTSARGSAYIYSYAAHRRHAFFTLCVTLNREEPADFVKFSRSLNVREERKSLRKEIVAALIALVAIVGIVQWFRSR